MKETVVLFMFILIVGNVSLVAQTKLGGTPIYHTNDKVGIGVGTPNATFDVLGKAKFRGLNGGKVTIDESLAAILVGTGQSRSGAIGTYFPGIGFNHLLTYTNSPTYTWDNQMHAWLGTRLIATPHSELSALVFATTTNTGEPGTQFPTEKMVILPNGNVGIGILEPEAKLHVGVPHRCDQDEEVRLGSYYNNMFYGIGLNYRINSIGSVSKHLVEYHNGVRYTAMSIMNGNVGIGTTAAPKYKLDVLGTIRANEIKVTAQTADFVFEPDYNLRPLNEVEAFVKENKHLPEIPSAKQMEADGVNVAEMNKLLLQKVEELTLYAINQEMEIRKLKYKEIDYKEILSQLEVLKEEIRTLKKK